MAAAVVLVPISFSFPKNVAVFIPPEKVISDDGININCKGAQMCSDYLDKRCCQCDQMVELKSSPTFSKSCPLHFC